MPRHLALALALLALTPALGLAQASEEVTPGTGEAAEAEARPETPPADAQPAETTAEPSAETTAEPSAETPPPAPTESGEAPKVAVVVSGDPDERLRGLARRVDTALSRTLSRPYDPGLRAALRGDPAESGEGDDGLGGVRAERRRLGLDEARDAPVLATLGRRAGAVAVAVARMGREGPELVVLDVRHGAFFDGALPLGGSVADARIVEFVTRRARVAARGAPSTPSLDVTQVPSTAAPDGATAADEEEAHEPDFFEQFWPYMVAGVLLAAMIVAIVVTSTTAGTDQPVLRFVPGGP